MSATTCIVAADVGNTALKLCVKNVETGQPETIVDHSIQITGDHWQSRAVQWVQEHVGCQEMRWQIASVHRRAGRRLQQTIAQRQPDATVHQTTRHDIPMSILVDAPDQLGIDRLIGAYAAHNRFGAPVVVVDAGSAVTVDYVSTAGEFVGGAIMPGLSLQTRSLAVGTDALPHIDWNSDSQLQTPGKNTAEAIRLGVLLGLAGAIDRLVHQYQEMPVRSSQNGQVVVTGGDAGNLSAHLQIPHEIVPNLVCRGLLDLPRSSDSTTNSGASVK